MAVIIDGSTYPKYFKITPNDASPLAFTQIPKEQVVFVSTGEAAGLLIDAGSGANALSIGTDANAINEFGNALNTSAKVARYLNDNK